jgi:uncharacterized protein
VYKDETPIGLFKGFSPNPRELEVEVVVPHGRAGLPSFGEFILIEMDEGKAAVGRVIHYHPTGPLATTQGDTYLSEMGRDETKFPEAIRELVLRYSMKVALLGILHKDSKDYRFESGVRSLAKLGMHVRRPSPGAIQYLANVGLDRASSATVKFGNLALGEDVRKDVEVLFSIDRLKGKRSFVFARAGYGKSNLIKYLLAHLYEMPPDVGLLILDPEGEYALPQEIGGRNVPGLASLKNLRERICYYTMRDVDPSYSDIYKGSVKVNLGDFSPRSILNAFVPPEKHDQVWANWIKGMWDQKWRNLIELLSNGQKGWNATDSDLCSVLGRNPQELKKGNVSLGAIKNNLIPPIERLHDSKSTLAKDLLDNLKGGKIVIVDISVLGSEDGLSLAGLLMQRIFNHNLEALTSQDTSSKVRTLVVLEEAQTILGHKNLSENSIFIRWVKEGRKYDLGAILITQQPGAIAPEILSQGDNFFVMHLLNQDDLDCLRRVNAHYSFDLLDQIRNEPIKGNCFFWSAPDQPYVICAKVHNFDDIVKHGLTKEKPETEILPVQSRAPLSKNAKECYRLVNSEESLWVFLTTIKDKPFYAFSYSFLKRLLEGKIGVLSEDKFSEILKELKWKIDYQARFTANRSIERAVILPEKHWKPQGRKLPKGKIEVQEKP